MGSTNTKQNPKRSAMNRRSFLKTAIIATGAVVVNPIGFFSDAFKYIHFNPKHEYGNAFYVTDTLNGLNTKKFIDRFIEAQINDTIPLKYRNKIIYSVRNARPMSGDPYCQRGTIAWKYSPNHRPSTNPHKSQWTYLNGRYERPYA